MAQRKEKNLKEAHFRWMKRGVLPGTGLCVSLSLVGLGRYKDSLDLFIPIKAERVCLKEEGLHSKAFWGSGLRESDPGLYYGYTPLRQTLVLFLLAMHDEI